MLSKVKKTHAEYPLIISNERSDSSSTSARVLLSGRRPFTSLYVDGIYERKREERWEGERTHPNKSIIHLLSLLLTMNSILRGKYCSKQRILSSNILCYALGLGSCLKGQFISERDKLKETERINQHDWILFKNTYVVIKMFLTH